MLSLPPYDIGNCTTSDRLIYRSVVVLLPFNFFQRSFWHAIFSGRILLAAWECPRCCYPLLCSRLSMLSMWGTRLEFPWPLTAYQQVRSTLLELIGYALPKTHEHQDFRHRIPSPSGNHAQSNAHQFPEKLYTRNLGQFSIHTSAVRRCSHWYVWPTGIQKLRYKFYT